MKNKLTDLNNYLFEQLEILSGTDETDEETERALKKADAINKVADRIIKNGELQLESLKLATEYGYTNDRQVGFLLGCSKDEDKVE